MKTVPTSAINISPNGGSFIEDKITETIEDIIEKISIEFDIEYRDVTIKDIFLKTRQFAREIDEILSAEITAVDNIFNTTPDFNSFKNQKLV
jgi:hypothetical protein